jgi:outer membrane protein
LTALQVADREIDKSRAAHSPTLDLTAGYGINYASGSISSPADIATRTRSGQVGLNLTVPLFAGGGVQARVREAIALKEKASEDLEVARRQAITQARQAFTGVVNGAAQVDALESAISSSKSSLDANKVGYRIGTRINIDVFNAEQQLYSAQRDWHKARAETLMQGLRLKASNATLGETDLQAINDLLETEP